MVLRKRESRSPPVFIFEPLFLSFDRKRGFFVFDGFGLKEGGEDYLNFVKEIMKFRENDIVVSIVEIYRQL